MPPRTATKAATSQQVTTVDVQSLGSAGAVFFLSRHCGSWLWQWQSSRPSRWHYRDSSSREQKYRQLPVAWADELQWGRSFFPSWSLTSLTSQLPWFTHLEKPSNLSSTSGVGPERLDLVSWRFQYGGHHKEGSGKWTGGRGGRQEGGSFLTGQYVALWSLSDNIFMNKYLLSNIRISTTIKRVLITCCFTLG